jgi:peroxiredoxin
MSALHSKYASRGLAIVAVNLDKEQPLADEFLDRFPAPFTVAFDPIGTSAEAFKVAAMPTTFLISKDGHILAKHVGYDSKQAAALESQIEEALR